MWYDYLGGRKAYKELIAAGLGVMAWFTIPEQARVDNLFQFLLYWAGCLAIYAYSNITAKKIKNGDKPK